MSLRNDIHEAFDELEPRTRGLSERVIETVVRERPRRVTWSTRVRAPLSLIAAVLVIAVVAVALMGGRLARDWNSFLAPHHQAGIQTPLQKLEARPLHLPTVQSIAKCPDGPYNKSGELGSGPLHPAASAVVPQTAWGSYYPSVLLADGPVKGPLLMRIRDLITNQPVVFVGQYAYGPTVGTDVLDGQVVEQHLEMVVDVAAEPYAWPFESGVPKGTSGCLGWQFDGPDFTETIAFNFNS